MKHIIHITLLLLITGIKLNAQYMINDSTIVYSIKHYDYFSFMNSEPTKKEWEFKLEIKRIGENAFKASFSKELVFCLFHLNKLREKKIHLNTNGISFNYALNDYNSIKVTNKDEAINYLEKLKKYQSSVYKKKHLKEILNHVDFYLEYTDELEKDLTRELKLIHEYENMDIPINISGKIDNNYDPINIEELEDDEIDFLKKVNWKTMKRIEVYKTPQINESDFMFDYMVGIDVLSSEEKADFEEIIKKYFDNNLEIGEYRNVTLNREQRILTKNTKKLKYLFKNNRTVSQKIKKITKLEIIKE